MIMAEMGLEPVTTGVCDRRNGVRGLVCTAAILSRSCPLWVKSRHGRRKIAAVKTDPLNPISPVTNACCNGLKAHFGHVHTFYLLTMIGGFPGGS